MSKKIKLKYKVRQLSNGKWAVWKNAKQYFSLNTYDTEADAVYSSLLREGHEINDKLDDLQDRLEATGRIDSSDPYGWRA